MPSPQGRGSETAKIGPRRAHQSSQPGARETSRIAVACPRWVGVANSARTQADTVELLLPVPDDACAAESGLLTGAEATGQLVIYIVVTDFGDSDGEEPGMGGCAVERGAAEAKQLDVQQHSGDDSGGVSAHRVAVPDPVHVAIATTNLWVATRRRDRVPRSPAARSQAVRSAQRIAQPLAHVTQVIHITVQHQPPPARACQFLLGLHRFPFIAVGSLASLLTHPLTHPSIRVYHTQ